MPDSIVIAAIIGVIVIVCLIKRSRTKPEVEFRQDTLRYITIDPDRKKRNHLPASQPQQAPLSENVEVSAATETERVVSREGISERQEPPEPALVDAGRDTHPNDLFEPTDHPPSSFPSPDVCVRGER
ncbi:hypothetical protein C2W62_15925 [Candidatus Entotheonella serta]|nr:hypothetical protein C2W62_15925 [Candidatus Entotheonella serta]